MADYSDMTNLLAGMPGGQPARPYTPGPSTLPARMEADIMDALYGDAQPPLPSWIPPNVQNYILTTPSRSEGQVNQVPINGGEPYSPTPQIGDLQRLFHNRMIANNPTRPNTGFNSQQLRTLMQMPGFSGFAGGTDI
jgi:hypothetical protein